MIHRPMMLILLALAAPLLQSCISARQATATAFLPFAAIGDTVIAPFQAAGRASDSLIDSGDWHANEGNVSREWLCYVPGYALWPCAYCTPRRWFALTQDCLKDINSGPAVPKPTGRQSPTRPPAQPPMPPTGPLMPPPGQSGIQAPPIPGGP